jgi:hypothetical protein
MTDRRFKASWRFMTTGRRVTIVAGRVYSSVYFDEVRYMGANGNVVRPEPVHDTSDLMRRMLRVNALVHDHASYQLINSGEMRCPECNSGTLCYLISDGQRSIVECSTPGCLRWDIAPARRDK